MIGRALYPLQLRQRLLLVETLLFAVVLSGVLATTLWYANALRTRIDRERLNATVSLAGEIDRLLTDAATELRLLAATPIEQRHGPGGWTRGLTSTVFTGGVVSANAQGRVQLTDPPAASLVGADLSPWLGDASRGAAGLLGWAMPSLGGPSVMALAVPSPESGGWVVGLVDQQDSTIARALRSAKLIGETGHADLLSGAGVSMLSTELEHLNQVADHPDYYRQMFDRADRAPRVAQVPYIENGVNAGEDHVMGFEYLTTLPWAVVLGGDASQTYAPIRTMWYSVAGLTSAFVLVALVITWLGSNQLVRPIQALTGSAKRVAGGELDTPLTTEVGGEIEALGESIDRMRQSLAAWGRELDQRVQLRTMELQQRTDELAASEAVARDASSSLNLRPLLEAVAATIEQRLPVDGVVLYTAGTATRPDVVVSSPGVSHGVAQESSACFTCTFANPLADWEQTPWRALPSGSICDTAGYRTSAVLPLRAGDRQVGTMCLLRRESSPPPNALEGQFLALLAAEVGMGTGNALLFEDLRLREEHRRELVVKVLSAQEEERKRLARELHDGTGQSLTALLLGIDAIASTIEHAEISDRNELVENRLAFVRSLAEGALSELRKMVLALRPSDLDDLGLVPAITRYASLSSSNSGIGVEVNADIGSERLPSDLEIAIFRIVQEALNNVVRHSHATQARVEISRYGATLVVEVSDNGIGFTEIHSSDPMAGVGIDGMRERASLVGGTLDIESVPGTGTTVRLSVQTELHIGGLDAATQAPRRAG